jgi:hypothetical protein
MRQLLEVVDEILRVEAYTNEEDIPNFGNAAIAPSCAFCGGEVFQKIFSCKNRCLKDKTVGSTPMDVVSICPSCYVDGRTCFCGEMTPFRLRPISPMVTSRDKIAAWFRSNSKDVLLSDDSEDETPTEDPHEDAEL